MRLWGGDKNQNTCVSKVWWKQLFPDMCHIVNVFIAAVEVGCGLWFRNGCSFQGLLTQEFYEHQKPYNEDQGIWKMSQWLNNLGKPDI